MLEINATWNSSLRRFEVTTIKIEGLAPIELPYKLLAQLIAERRAVVKEEEKAVYIDDYRLQVIAQSRNLNGAYMCRLIREKGQK